MRQRLRVKCLRGNTLRRSGNRQSETRTWSVCFSIWMLSLQGGKNSTMFCSFTLGTRKGFRCNARRNGQTKAQCDLGSLYIYLNVNQQQNNKEKQMNVQPCRAQKQQYNNKIPQTTSGKRLTKYDHQSETTIDSCLWLGTIPGQHRYTKTRLHIEIIN